MACYGYGETSTQRADRLKKLGLSEKFQMHKRVLLMQGHSKKEADEKLSKEFSPERVGTVERPGEGGGA